MCMEATWWHPGDWLSIILFFPVNLLVPVMSCRNPMKADIRLCLFLVFRVYWRFISSKNVFFRHLALDIPNPNLSLQSNSSACKLPLSLKAFVWATVCIFLNLQFKSLETYKRTFSQYWWWWCDILRKWRDLKSFGFWKSKEKGGGGLLKFCVCLFTRYCG